MSERERNVLTIATIMRSRLCSVRFFENSLMARTVRSRETPYQLAYTRTGLLCLLWLLLYSDIAAVRLYNLISTTNVYRTHLTKRKQRSARDEQGVCAAEG